MTRAGHAHAARLVQLSWLAFALAVTLSWAVVFVAHWQALRTACHPQSTCAAFQLDTASARVLAGHGFSVLDYAVLTTAVLAVTWAIWFGLGALIIWRKPGDRGAVMCAIFLVLSLTYAVSSFVPNFENVGGSVSVSVLVVFCLLFPDGRFAPGWASWLAVAGVLASSTIALPVPGVAVVPLFLVLGAVVGVQIYRYRRVSTWSQRQQTKWAVLGILLGFLGFMAIALPYVVTPRLTGYGSLYDGMTNVAGTAAVTSVIPIFLGIAVFRSRLWDIDRVINRALVYATLSATIAGMYVGGVLGLQALFRLVAGSSSTLAVALSTLAIAVLFGPLRRRIQVGIDRRFYRSKYDAARTLAAFGDHVRDEVDLAHLADELTTVVHDTLHPQHVSLWLREG